MKKIVIYFLMLIVVFCGAMDAAFAQEISGNEMVDEPYCYPLTPGTEEWKNTPIETLYERSAVPSGLAETMTTRALLRTVLDYPFIVNIYAWDTPQQGIDKMRSRFEPLDIFLNRTDALTEVQLFLDGIDSEEDETENTIEYYIAGQIKKFILVNMLRYEIDPVTGAVVAYVYTPQNNAVRVLYATTYANHGTTASEAASATSYFAVIYNATVVSPADSEYNCHSYAWYSTSSLNPYWMDNPNKYMTDGSYSGVSSPAIGDKITYKIGNTLDHSGIITGTGSTIYVTSKWGCAGVLRHTLTNNLYYMEDCKLISEC